MSLAERGYRAALRAYPARYRAERGEEILATLAEAYPGRRLPVPGEVAALLRAGLAERNRADLAEARPDIWWKGLAGLALPLACANAALGLTGLAVATSRGGPGKWWLLFALVSVALAAVVAAGLRWPAPPLGLATLALVAADAWTMGADSSTMPHIRLLEHFGDTRPIPFPNESTSVPSNPTEILPFAFVLALACIGLWLVQGSRPAAGPALLKVAVVLVLAAAFAAVALADPSRRLAFLLVPALAVALGGLVAGLVWARAAVFAAGLLVASAPSVLWVLSARRKMLPEGVATRDIVPGLIVAGLLLLLALVAAGLARWASRPYSSRSR